MNAETLRAYGVRDLEDVQQNLDKSITKAVYRSSADLQRLRGLCAEDGTVDYECIVTNKRGNAASLLVHTEVITTLEGKRAVYTTFLDVSENESVKSEKRILNTLYQDYIAFFYLGFNQGTISILKSDKSTVLFASWRSGLHWTSTQTRRTTLPTRSPLPTSGSACCKTSG